MLKRVLIAMLCGGRVLLEGVPGLAKTLTVRTLANVLGGSFSRVQFTSRSCACTSPATTCGAWIRRSARTREPHVRLQVPERAMTTWLVPDVSPSMRFGTAVPAEERRRRGRG